MKQEKKANIKAVIEEADEMMYQNKQGLINA